MLIILMHLLGSKVKLAISTVLFYFSSVNHCWLYRLWLTFDQTAFDCFASEFSANRACCDYGF
jgi:hypothetical protein